MIVHGRLRIVDWRSRQLFQLCLLSSVVCLLFGTGCTTGSRRAPGRTVVEVRPTVLPARLISNFFVVEANLDGGAPYRFLVDTGSTVSYVTPKLAQRFAVKEKKGATPRLVRVRSAHGEETELPALTLRQLRIGASLFERVPALAYDFTDLSSHLGLQIDGIIGFPVFQHTLLTLDYLEKRLIIAPSVAAYAPPPKQTPRVSTLTFGNQQGTPLIPIQMGNESFVALIDSGSDGSLSLNPAGLHPRFANGPRAGTIISSLQGDRPQLTGRLDQSVLLGTNLIHQPIVDLTDQLSSIGGEILRHFAVTFDQRRNLVTFARETDGPVAMESRRHTGLSFARSPAYWRVLAVIPDTPTAALPVQAGDLCVRINGEPVDKWDYERYAALLKAATKVTYTFLTGTKETDLEVPIFTLVP
jgi:hypothetical protein